MDNYQLGKAVGLLLIAGGLARDITFLWGLGLLWFTVCSFVWSMALNQKWEEIEQLEDRLEALEERAVADRYKARGL